MESQDISVLQVRPLIDSETGNSIQWVSIDIKIGSTTCTTIMSLAPANDEEQKDSSSDSEESQNAEKRAISEKQRMLSNIDSSSEGRKCFLCGDRDRGALNAHGNRKYCKSSCYNCALQAFQISPICLVCGEDIKSILKMIE